MYPRLFLAVIVSIGYVRGDECYERFGGICVPTEVGRCPFMSGGFSWIGCLAGAICCFPSQEPTPPPQIHQEPRMCGLRQVGTDGAFRIVGGWEAPFGAWPWVVSVEYLEKEDPHLCGAALLNNRWVLTASHCFMNDNDPKLYRVVVGQNNRHFRVGHERVIPIEAILIHERFNTPHKANDIALVRLAEPVEFGDFVQPVCLPSEGEDFEGYVCTVVGWGITNMYSQQQMSALMEVNLPILPRDHCNRMVFPFHETNICAGFRYGSKDACGGDSGGPMMCKSQYSQNWKLVGVISWGHGCARPDNPGVYTEVSKYLRWIDANTRDGW